MTDNKYKNGKIYTIRNKNDDNLIYNHCINVSQIIKKTQIMKNTKNIIDYYIEK
jgi:hypothetical protein